ncbi:peroxide stress protein YaaA [Moraxella canis]|uniref:peroxide stress protein YaaA n=1 Tax=Moraxella canis TaxID=90239 RepID=UPI0006688828|nr:peroxide stress protein YaaA [Moraxella canis]
MFFLLSPAKNLDEKTPVPLSLADQYSEPALIDDAITLMQSLKDCDVIDLQELMGVSAKIAELNVDRNQRWAYPFGEDAKPAIYLFAGDVYTGLDAYHLDKNEIGYLNDRLGILSGLYGLLRPLDLMLPYRLEMGTKFKTAKADNLYQFWGDKITDQINQHLKQSDQVLVNLASNEYFSAVNPSKIEGRIITPRFEDQKNGKYKVVSFYAKKARGLMVNYAAKYQLTNAEDLKNFDSEGYYFVPELSDEDNWVFRRDEV